MSVQAPTNFNAEEAENFEDVCEKHGVPAMRHPATQD